MKSNYVLFSDGQQYHVYPRTGNVDSYKLLEHFEGFFETESAAYEEAIKRTESKISTLKTYMNRYKRESRKKGIK